MMPFNNSMGLITPIFIIGYRCTGKSTTGRLLARMLNRPFMDTDLCLESQFSVSISKMVETKGWAYFRQQETQVLIGLDLSSGPVVATGGGIVLAEENRRWIKENGYSVWLHADTRTLISRIGADAPMVDHRPDLTSLGLEEETRSLLDVRIPLYRELGGDPVNTAENSPDQAALQIKRRLDHEWI